MGLLRVAQDGNTFLCTELADLTQSIGMHTYTQSLPVSKKARDVLFFFFKIYLITPVLGSLPNLFKLFHILGGFVELAIPQSQPNILKNVWFMN